MRRKKIGRSGGVGFARWHRPRQLSRSSSRLSTKEEMEESGNRVDSSGREADWLQLEIKF